MIAVLWPKVEAGDLQAIDRVLSIMARRAKLLGIDQEKPASPNTSTSVALQNINVSTSGALTDEQRASAIRAILARTGHSTDTYLQHTPTTASPLGNGSDGQSPDGQGDSTRHVLDLPGAADDGGGADSGPVADEGNALFD
jgi:hypothetical protein